MKALQGTAAALLIFGVLLVPMRSEELFLRVASYNIKTLSNDKCNRPQVMALIAERLSYYDLVAIQELNEGRQEQFKCLEKIVSRLNRQFVATPYQGIRGPLQGSTIYKEQYAFVYRTDRLVFMRANVTEGLLFERPPMGALFHWRTADSAQQRPIFFVNIHTKPVRRTLHAAPTVEEIKKLFPAYVLFAKEFRTVDAVILGDFNAGTLYRTLDDGLGKLELAHPPGCPSANLTTWPLGHSTNTMVELDLGRGKAHDQIVFMGSWLPRIYVSGSATATRYPEAGSVSDHLPIEITLHWDTTTPYPEAENECVRSYIEEPDNQDAGSTLKRIKVSHVAGVVMEDTDEDSSDADTDAGSGSDTDSGSGSGSDTDAGSGSDTDAGSGSDTDSGSSSDTDSGSSSDSDSDSDSSSGSDTDSGSSSDSDSDADSDFPSGAHSGTSRGAGQTKRKANVGDLDSAPKAMKKRRTARGTTVSSFKLHARRSRALSPSDRGT